jgi:hypothetical protein
MLQGDQNSNKESTSGDGCTSWTRGCCNLNPNASGHVWGWQGDLVLKKMPPRYHGHVASS